VRGNRVFDKNIKPFDQSTERAVLAGILHNPEVMLDVDEILSHNDFSFSIHAVTYDTFKDIIVEDDAAIDETSFANKLKQRDGAGLFGHKLRDIVELFSMLKDISVVRRNVMNNVKMIKKFSIARQLRFALMDSDTSLEDIKGNEPIDQILSMAEEGVFKTSMLLSKQSIDTVRLGQGFYEYAQETANNPVDIVGIPTGFPRWDLATGGVRRKTTSLIGARPKRGKSSIGINMARYLGERNHIPTLYLDTELNEEIQRVRLGAAVTDVPIREIETGRWKQNKDYSQRIEKSRHLINNLPIYFRSAAGLYVPEYLSVMRRWVVKEVGRAEDGRVNDCLIILDWLKLTDSKELSRDIREFQVLGFMLSQLHDFCVVYDVPMIVFIQLNREGISRDAEDVISGSDRLTFLCDSLSIISNKPKEEIARDGGPENGDKRLTPILLRYGEGLNEGDYINLITDLSRCRVEEGKLFSELISPPTPEVSADEQATESNSE